MNINIKNILFSGGSIKGYSYIGVFKALEEAKAIDNISCIVGVSIGALFATLLNIKYSYKDLYSILMKLNFDNVNNITTDNVLSYFDTFGIETGEKLMHILEIIIKKKTNKSNITFQELYELTNIKLIITTVCVNTKEYVYLDYTNSPNEKIISAIRKSMGIPLIFTPFKDNEKLYVDGGLINNYPMEIFDNEQHETLGILIYDQDILEEETKINSFDEYFLSLVDCVYKQNLKKTLKKHYKNTIVLKSNINFLNFFVTNQEKNHLVDLGYKNVKKYLLDKYKIQLFLTVLQLNQLLKNNLIENYNKENYTIANYQNDEIDNIYLIKKYVRTDLEKDNIINLDGYIINIKDKYFETIYKIIDFYTKFKVELLDDKLYAIIN